MGVNGCFIGSRPAPCGAQQFPYEFRMEKFDEHQNLRLLRPVFPARHTRQKPHLLFGTVTVRKNDASRGDKPK
jgi:hypothetical protein